MNIALLEPFLGGSHRQWAKGLQAYSRHHIRLLGLPGRHWKWRMHGGAVSLARQLREAKFRPDVLLATDMLDLSVFLGLTRDLTADIPVALYFHENQLAYPWSPTDADPALKRDNHYRFINFTSALAADRILFNSRYNRDSFLEGLPTFLNAFPDHREADLVAGISAKSQVLPLGLDLERLDLPSSVLRPPGPPIVLWNHRWEYDKGPTAFFEALIALKAEGVPFRLVVLGERFKRIPPIFEQARAALADRILHWGYAEGQDQYAAWLWKADILPVTSHQDFFGGSIVEAMYCGCWPLLPDRLAYPGHIPVPFRDTILYQEATEFLPRLRQLLTQPLPGSEARKWVAAYDWRKVIEQYDQAFAQIGHAKTDDDSKPPAFG